jgi:periplasmic copper chaperone A
MKKTPIMLALAGALVAVPAASAHVTVNPRTVQADSFARFAIRVPDEADDAQTIKVTVQLPASVGFVSFQPKPGWERTVTMVKLAKPITNDEGETVTERIDTVTWEGGRIAPGEFDEFGMSAKVPAAQGKLVFPAVQTYSNGDVVRWIGDPASDTPAPRVIVTPRAGDASATAPTAADASSDDGDRDGLTLGLAIAGLVAGLVALGLVLFRKPKAT